MRSVDELGNRLAVAFEMSEYKQIEDLARAIGGQRVLLVLDNAEDLITTSADTRLDFQSFCGILLRSCSGLRFLLSTRRALGSVEGAEEIEVPIGRLQPPHDLAVFQAAAAPRLTPQEKSSAELMKLVQTLEGHPLSLTLVAGQVGRGMSLTRLRQRLEEDGDAAVVAHEFLGMSESEWSADERLRTKRLMSSLNLSFTPLLSKHPEAAEVFLWLGLFPAGLLAGLVSSLFGDRGEEQVALLSEHNLLERLGNPERLILPAPVRWYAKREMARIPEERRRYLLKSTFQALGQSFHAAYKRAATEHASDSFELVLREEPNLAFLLMAIPMTPADADLSDRIAEALVSYLRVQSLADRPSAATALGKQAVEAISASSPGAAAHAQILRALGDLHLRMSRWREAEESYRSALPMFQKIEAQPGEANTLRALGDLYMRTSRLRQAEESCQSALLIYKRIEDRFGEANTRQTLGDLYMRTSRLREAEESYLSALVIHQQIKNRLGEANTRKAMGHLYVLTAQLRKAGESFQRAFYTYQQIKHQLGEAYTLRGLGQLSSAQGDASDLERSIVLSGRAWAQLKKIEDPTGQYLALTDLTTCFFQLEDKVGMVPSIILTWHLARRIEEPSAEPQRDLLRQILPDFNPEAEPVEEWLPGVEATLIDVLQRYEKALAERGEDPLSLLNPHIPEPGSSASEGGEIT